MSETSASNALFERAKTVIPGGVNSPVRACRSVGAAPLFISHGDGAHVVTADGERLIDLIGRRPAEQGAQEAPAHAALSYLIGLDSAPHCAAALEGWIAILLASKEPLDPADPQREGRLLELLGRRLRRVDGRWIGGEAARRALENRRRQFREGSLRKMGLESTADALGRRR